MPMLHAYCQNSADHAKLADKVAKSMEKTLKPSLKSRCEFYEYSGSGHYYYFINAIRVISYIVLDNGSIKDKYSGEYRRDYVYSDDEYNRDIFINTSLLYDLSVYFYNNGGRAIEVDMYKKSFFTQLNNEKNRYKFEGIYVNKTEHVVVDGKDRRVAMLKAGLKTGDIVSIDNRDCFLIGYSGDWISFFLPLP
ncbi:MAG: hypothetical protein SPJ69_07630 [Campylobacter sp.]|uniref:hypothetical protein n=1 Tax=Campylobacter sp. TaxID=205 RepID=UPI002978F817|nr:hypothetical protein [Campylobacter sp.]MDD7600627.1 hypothetical protein [Campylobacteraceae bacterium]MDY5888173.1 hypothetical protein [Campylobacter sp.]